MSEDTDVDLLRLTYDIMADQAADRQRGPAMPSYKREGSLRGYFNTPLPQANFDGQLNYETGLPQAPLEYPSYTPDSDDAFMDRVQKLMRRMGLTSGANFIGGWRAESAGPRFSNREAVATEVESPFATPGPTRVAAPVTYERGVGFSRNPLTPRHQQLKDIAMAQGPGILAGPKAAARFDELQAQIRAAQAAYKDRTVPVPHQKLWNDYQVGVGIEGKPRIELSDDFALTPKGLDAAATPHGTWSNQSWAPAHQLIDWPALYKVYPELADVMVRLGSRQHSYLGTQWAPRGGDTGWIEGSAALSNDLMNVIRHEFQHAVQDIEGIPAGANANKWRGTPIGNLTGPQIEGLRSQLRMQGWHPENANYLRHAGEVEARNVEARALDPQLRNFAPSLTEDIDRLYQIIRYMENGSKSAVKDPGGMWSPLAQDAFQRYLSREVIRPNEARWFAEKGRMGDDYANPYLVWEAKAAKNYLNKYAGTERDPLKDMPMQVGIPRNVPLPPGQIPPWEGFQDVRVINEDRTWGQIMDKVIRQMPFEEFLASFKNRRSTSQLAPDILQEIAKLENAFRAGKIRSDEPVWDLTRQMRSGVHASWPNNRYRRAFIDQLGHVGSEMRGHVPYADLSRYDFPRAFREAEQRRHEALKIKEEALKDVFAGTTSVKKYDDGMQWVEVGKSDHVEKSRAALQKEGELMGHCVGGYCDAVESGRSRIFSLRDAKGEPHVTIEVNPNTRFLDLHHELVTSPSGRTILDNWRADSSTQRGVERTPNKTLEDYLKDNHPDVFEKLIGNGRISINQIKGKQNRPPDEKYLKQVEDFINDLDKDGTESRIKLIRDVPFKSLFEISDYTNHPSFKDRVFSELGRKRWYLQRELRRVYNEWRSGNKYRGDERDALDL